MYLLAREQRIPRSREQVFPFFADSHNLERITPPALSFKILSRAPVEMRAGAVIDYQLRLAGVPFRWRTVIETWEPPHLFVDIQERGPYRMWRHTHSFDEVPGGTLMGDRVEYALPFGPLGKLAHALVIRRQLEAIFAFRHRVVAEMWPPND